MPRSDLLLLRHGQSTWNAEGRWQGIADPPLTDLGREQARAAIPALAELGLSAVASSDLARAKETAEILADALGLPPVEVDSHLRERDVGEWSGLTSDEIAERWPDVAEARRRGERIPPVGSDNAGYEERALSVMRRIAAAHPGERVLVLTHSAFIRTIERELGERPLRCSNLSGRWFHVADDEVSPGEQFGECDDSESPI